MRQSTKLSIQSSSTWKVAEAIHRRCCAHTGCSGPYQHLQEAAAAVEALAGRVPPAHTPLRSAA
ncbi:MAG: hypothetical protein ACYCSJ_07205 [Acidimicrobiales bacterium]